MKSLTVNATSINLNGGAINTTLSQTYNNPVVLGAGTVLTTTTGDVIFANTINGAYDLSITAGGSTTFGGEVGTASGEALRSLTVSSGTGTNINTANITTTGAQSYTGSVVLGGASPTTFTTTNSSIGFFGNITGAGQNIKLSSGTGNVGLQGVSTVGALQLLGTGNKTLSGAIGNTASLNIAAGGTTFINAPSITTTGNQVYGNAVSLLANTALSGNNISFVNAINGAYGLGITAAGSVTFGGAVGVSNALDYLTVTAPGGINISGGAINTVLSQIYNNPVVLGANTVLTTTNAAGNIVFVTTVNSDGTLRALELNVAGNTTFGGAVGSIRPLSSLLIDTSAGTTYLNGGAVTTSGNQAYGENVILGADTTFNAANIVFVNALNSDTTPRLPTFNIVGNTIFGGAVGTTNALSSLTTGTTGTMYINGGWVNTIGIQYYQEPVILGANTLLTGSAIGFTSTIDSSSSISPSSLTLSTPGNVVFAGMIGGNIPLQNLTVGGGGILYFFGKGATTTGFQTYNDAINLNQNIFLTGSNLTFNSTISGPHNLALDVGSSGNIIFNGAVGAYANSIGLMYINNAHNVTANAPIYVTAFEQNAGSGVTLFNNTLYVGMGSSTGFAHGTGPAIIKTNSVTGDVDVGTLYLGVSSSMLTGYVGGVTSVPAAENIKVLNQITPGTNYYDAIDLYGLEPIAVLNDSLMLSILASLYGSLNFGFGYEFLDIGSGKFDYLFLLEPPQCSE